MNRDSLFDESIDSRYGRNRIRLIILVVIMVGGTIWSLIHFNVRKPGDTELPPKPWTKSDLPALHRNLKSLEDDAGILGQRLSALRRSPEGKVDAKVWEEIYYASEHYPEFAEYRRVETAKILQLHPDLAAYGNLVKDYSEARHAIATDSRIADKTVAVAALNKKFELQFKNPDYARNRKAFDAARDELFGDPEFDKAAETYRRAHRDSVLKQHPELAAYFQTMEAFDGGYASLKAKANALSRDIQALEQ